MTQVMNHNLGYKIVHNPGYDFELGHKNRNEFFYYPGFLKICYLCRIYIRGTSPHSRRFTTYQRTLIALGQVRFQS